MKYLIEFFLCLLLLNSSLFADRMQDSLALVALYNSTDGDNWTNNTNWLSDEPIDDWIGVTVENGRVVRIILRCNNMVGQLPADIGNLSVLKELNLRGGWGGDCNTLNRINGSIPLELENLDSLQILDLAVNQVSGNIPVELGNLDNLIGLYLQRNNLSGSIPSEIGNLTNLEELQLDQNQLTDSIPQEIGDLSNLTYLGLERNDLTGGIPSSIGNLTNLTYLGLSFNENLGDTIPPELGNLSNLTTLDLRRCNLSGSFPIEMCNLNLLTGINLADNPLTGSIPPEIGNLANLEGLWLFWVELSGSIPPEIGNLTKLKDLRIGPSNISGNIPTEIGNCINLSNLQLIANNLTGEVPIEILNLTNLVGLYITQSKLDKFPDISSFNNIQNLELWSNRLEFDDIEPNIGVASAEFRYSPQDSVGVEKSDTSCVGLSYTFDMTVGGENNRYQWFKDDTAVTSLSPNSEYTISNCSFADAGDYNCHITNTLATELTLYSRPIHFEVLNEPSSPSIEINGDWLESSEDEGNQWYLYGEKIPGAVGQKYLPARSGNYTVTKYLGCESSHSEEFYYILTGDIETIEREWGTYIGGEDLDIVYDNTSDKDGNIYITGITYSDNGISTTGAYQEDRASSDSSDAFLIKFNTDGEIVWGTYFGGTGYDIGEGIAIDSNNNIYIVGTTLSRTGIESSGSHQEKINGYRSGTRPETRGDLFLAKFNKDGNRLWSTYYGSRLSEYYGRVATDKYNNVYIGGQLDSDNGAQEIATNGAHKTEVEGVRDGFLVKFDSDGRRQWGTYYGGAGNWDRVMGIATHDNDVFITGGADSENIDSCIATSNAFHTQYVEGVWSSYIAKFNGDGERQWGTYVGSGCYDITADNNGNIFVCGVCNPDTNINVYSTDSAFQRYGSGYNDAFIVKFNNFGARKWGSFFGAHSGETAFNCCTDSFDNIYLSGIASSKSESINISTCKSYQENPGGSRDAFLIKTNNGGKRKWSSFFGGEKAEIGTEVWPGLPYNMGICTDNFKNVFLVGYTQSTSNISTPGSHQQDKSDSTDGFLVKFNQKVISTKIASKDSMVTYCEGDAIELIAPEEFMQYQWIEDGDSIIGATNQEYILPNDKSPGKYQYNVILGSDPCAYLSDTISITINPLPDKPTITQLGNDLISSSDSGNQWFLNGEAITDAVDKLFTPVLDGSYTVQVTDSNGCISEMSESFNYDAGPAATMFAGSGEAEPGGLFDMNIFMTNLQGIRQAGATGVTANLRLNATILDPVDSEYDGAVTGDERIIGLTIPVEPDSDSLLLSIPFRAMLGNTDRTTITLDSIKTVGSNLEIASGDGMFMLKGICMEGGPRLLNSSGEVQITKVSPNPSSGTLEIEFEVIEKGMTRLSIISSYGEKMLTMFSGKTKKGIYEVRADISSLSVGAYYILLQTPTIRKAEKLFIIK